MLFQKLVTHNVTYTWNSLKDVGLWTCRRFRISQPSQSKKLLFIWQQWFTHIQMFVDLPYSSSDSYLDFLYFRMFPSNIECIRHSVSLGTRWAKSILRFAITEEKSILFVICSLIHLLYYNTLAQRHITWLKFLNTNSL